MIRPYVTILKDSFHEAYASRVLWVLLVLTTLFLLSLAPLGLREGRSVELHINSISDWPALVAQIKYQSDEEQLTPGKHIWEKSNQEFKEAIDSSFGSDGSLELDYMGVATIFEQLNRLVLESDFYDEEAWKDVAIEDEFKKLAGRRTQLSKEELFYLNRELLRVGFPKAVGDMPEKEVELSYLTWTLITIPVSLDAAEPGINAILVGLMGFLLGVIAVFAAILVTAPIVPKTFEAGAIDLLLSKPVSRSLVFLVKFLGGCSYILFLGGYFVVGLWLIMGLRFGLWNHSLLLCIPLFMFLFVIYYSVSAMVGVIWKNAIVSVVMTILLWASCWLVGTAKLGFESVVIAPNRIVGLVQTERALLGVRETGEVVQWRDNNWEPAFTLNAAGGGPPMTQNLVLLGAIDDLENDRLTFLQKSVFSGPYGAFPTSPSIVDVVWRDGKWRVEKGPTVPTSASWLFETASHEQLVVTSYGISRRKGEEEQDGLMRSALKALIGGEGPFASLGPIEELDLKDSVAAAINPTSNDILLYGQKRLIRLVRNEDGKYRSEKQRTLEDGTDMALLTVVGNNIVLGLSDGRVLVLSANDLETQDEYSPAGNTKPIHVTSTSDGKWFAMLFQNGKLLLGNEKGQRVDVMGSGISAVAFDGNRELLVADRVHRVTSYRVGTRDIEKRRTPETGVAQAVYYYFIKPFYTVFPKPGELDNVVSHVLSDEAKKVSDRQNPVGLRQRTIDTDIYSPVYSSSIFVLVVLTITCIYIQRFDV